MKFDALDKPITNSDVSAYKSAEGYKQKWFFDGASDNDLSIIYAFAGATLVSGVLAGVFIKMGVGWVFGAISVLCLGGVFRGVVSAAKHTNIRWALSLRLSMLAEDNGWVYDRQPKDVHQNGLMFTGGHDYTYSNVLTGTDFQVGQVGMTVGSGRNARNISFTYLAVPLDADVPNMVLDSRANNFSIFGHDITNLPVSFEHHQKVSLEGDFNQYFTLYAPEGYGSDVRYIFTPDLMQELIEQTSGYDAETIDQTLYVYLGWQQLDTREFWEHMKRITMTIGDTMIKHAEFYKDDRTPDGSIAPAAQRLKHGIPVVTVIIIVFYVIAEIPRLVQWFNSH